VFECFFVDTFIVVTTKAKCIPLQKYLGKNQKLSFCWLRYKEKVDGGTIGNTTFLASLLVNKQISREFSMDITNLQVRPQVILLSNYQKDQNRTNTNVAEFNGRIEQRTATK
jgi:hypothetical protein